MAVNISGMFGNGRTYFAGSPVVIDIDGLRWPEESPFKIVRINIIYDNSVAGTFHADTGGQTSISFDISSALRAIWAEYDFSDEFSAVSLIGTSEWLREYRQYSIEVITEYIDSQDGELTQISYGTIAGGSCAIGRLTEWERAGIGRKEYADISYWDGSNTRFGDASTKPDTSPERVGSTSITSWVDLESGGTRSRFYAVGQPGAPAVLRDTTVPYTDFLFVNRRGAVETCSALMKESMGIDVQTKQYNRVERPSFQPSRSVMAVASGGRRSWTMSSGHQTREWADWWAQEFLMASRHWMLYGGRYVPVIVEPAKKNTTIYDRSKQQMASVDFTVTLALDG